MNQANLGLDMLLSWLEYGRASGYVAARCSKEQEEHWADLLKKQQALLADLDVWAEIYADVLRGTITPAPNDLEAVEALLARAREQQP